MKAIEDAIVQLEAERASFNMRIDGRIEGLRDAIRLQDGGSIAASSETRQRTRRGNLKETVLEMLHAYSPRGLTSEECVELAKTRKNIELVPSSVSSLLSRLKNDDVLAYDGQRYRLKHVATPRQVA